MGIWSLIRELRSHLPCGQKKNESVKKKKSDSVTNSIKTFKNCPQGKKKSLKSVHRNNSSFSGTQEKRSIWGEINSGDRCSSIVQNHLPRCQARFGPVLTVWHWFLNLMQCVVSCQVVRDTFPSAYISKGCEDIRWKPEDTVIPWGMVAHGGAHSPFPEKGRKCFTKMIVYLEGFILKDDWLLDH